MVSVSYWNIQQLMSTNFGYSGTTYNKVYNNRCPDLLRCNILIFPVNACSLISQTRVLRILQLNDNVSNCFPFTSEIACAGNSVDGLFFFWFSIAWVNYRELIKNVKYAVWLCGLICFYLQFLIAASPLPYWMKMSTEHT